MNPSNFQPTSEPDYQPRYPAPPKQAPQLSVSDLNAWLTQHHGQAIDELAGRGINLRFQRDLPNQPIALRVATDNASFSFALPSQGPMARYDQAESMVKGALGRAPEMELAFRSYDEAYAGLSKHQRGQVCVQNGPLEDRDGWQLLSQEGSGLGSWRTTTSTKGSLEEGVVVWCNEQKALRAATSKDSLVKLLQDPSQAVHNPLAPTLASSQGNASAFDLPGLTTERFAYRLYLSGVTDEKTAHTTFQMHVCMRPAHLPESVGEVVTKGATMELHTSGVQFAQGKGSNLLHSLETEELGVNSTLAGLFVHSGVSMVNVLPQYQAQEQESYDYTMGLDFNASVDTQYEFTR